MATWSSSWKCSQSDTNTEKNIIVQINYTAGNGSITIHKIRGQRTDGYRVYYYDHGTPFDVTLTVGSTSKNIKCTQIGFGAAAWEEWIGVTDTTFTAEGSQTVKVTIKAWDGTEYVSNGAYFSGKIDCGTATKTFTIKYNANGGSGTMSNTTVTYGTSTKIRTNTFTRTGYTFSGWHVKRTSDNKWRYESSDGSTKAWYVEGSQPDGYVKNKYADGATVSTTSSVNGDTVTFYAVWVKNKYLVTVDPNGGYRVSDGKTEAHTYNQSYNALEEITERRRDGYVLVGYKITNTSSGSTTDIGGATITFDSSTKTAEFKQGSVAVTLTAQWDNSSFKVYYNSFGGNIALKTQGFNYGNIITDLQTPSKDGYNFKRWYATFRGASTDALNLGRNYKYTDKISVHFEAYSADWSSYERDNQRLMSCYEGGGWTFRTSNGKIQLRVRDSGVGDKDANSNKRWRDLSPGWHTFDFTFDGSKATLYVDGVSEGVSEAFSSGKIGYSESTTLFAGAEAGSSLTTPSSGYNFVGMLANIVIKNSSSRITDAQNQFITPNHDFALYAEWEPKSYNVSFNSNSQVDNPIDMTVKYGDTFGTLPSLSADLYDITDNMYGWNTVSDGSGQMITSESIFNFTEDITLYAIWGAHAPGLTWRNTGGTWSLGIPWVRREGIWQICTLYHTNDLADDPNIPTSPVLTSITADKGTHPGYVVVEESIDLDGIIVTANYSDGSSKNVDNWTFSPKVIRTLVESPTDITIYYNEGGISKSTTLSFYVYT